MTMDTILAVGLLLALKHFWADGPFQVAWMYQNKGKLGHPGGIVHAIEHGVGTVLVLALCGVPWAFYIGLVDAFIHYWIDLAKVRLTAKYKWSYMMLDAPVGERGLVITSDWYFYALIADQCLHFATYIAIIWWIAR